MKKVLIGLTAVLGLLVLGVVVSGLVTPAEHVVSRESCLAASQEEVWTRVVEFERYAEWRDDVVRIETVSRGPGGAAVGSRFIEYGAQEPILFEIEEAVPLTRLVSRIADESLPFGGRWTYDLSQSSECSTVLKITEAGFVSNFLFRALSPLFSKTATMKLWLGNLEKELAARG